MFMSLTQIKWLITAITILASSNLFAGDPQKMAVLIVDSALDYQNPTLQKSLDIITLKKYKVITFNHPDGISLYDLNQEMFLDKKQDLLNSTQSAETAIWDLYVRSLSENGKLAMVKSASIPEEQKMFSETFQRSIKNGLWQKPLTSDEKNILGELSHGTHVAGLLIQGVENNVRLINIPFPGIEFRGQNVNQVLSNVINSLKVLGNAIGNISLLENVKVLNMSGGLSLNNIKNSISNAVINGRIPPEVAKSLDPHLVLKMAGTVFQTVINQNPDLNFVISAGNDGKSLNELPGMINYMNHANLVVVGSVNDHLRISVFSNTHPQLVDVLTEGEMIPSLAPFLPNIQFRFSGTSMATPRVGNRLIRVRLQEPTLSALKAKKSLLENESKPLPDLQQHSNQGKTMITHTELSEMTFSMSKHKYTCKKIYF